MLLGTVTKQPNERFDFDVDFTPWLAERADDTLGAVVSSVTPTGLLLIGISHDGVSVKQWVEGGTDGVLYTVTLSATTTGGRLKEVEVRVRVREVA